MKARNFALAFSALALAAASFAVNAGINFANLGTAAPPATLGGHAMTPFDQAPQAAIADFSIVSNVPGSVNGGVLGISPSAEKLTVPNTWSTWSHGYSGAIYRVIEGQQATLTLPANTQAFYFYVEPNLGVYNFTATTNTGVSSPSIPVNSEAAANGFAFYTTAGESITSITIAVSGSDFAVGEFGSKSGPATTCASEGYKGTKLNWCQNICENGLSGQVLDTWIHRWINRYRQLPYCAVENEGQPQ